MSFVDDVVAQWMARAERSGEMRGAAGKPLELDDGLASTPEELRAAYRILKNAGYVPSEVEQLRKVAQLRDELEASSDPQQRAALQTRIAELDTSVRIRLEHLRRTP